MNFFTAIAEIFAIAKVNNSLGTTNKFSVCCLPNTDFQTFIFIGLMFVYLYFVHQP
ncbi:hypothetical protein [Pleurocapsa sp. CCALA 161]|uniref:hypothetical protein n=1 Tax=Pleurocapsa sp. CCALA 161 TaxID=2107688 RepID=UPI001304B76C|nr:hypothetical protein [Pleurocapsa sp. CCALA 161]